MDSQTQEALVEPDRSEGFDDADLTQNTFSRRRGGAIHLDLLVFERPILAGRKAREI
jgi:hypothetical protein